jgi:hypothetical protein
MLADGWYGDDVMARTETNAFELESETRLKVSESLSKIEVALSEWDSARKKPKKLENRIEYLRLSHTLLSGWARDSLRGKKDEGSTISRLARFIELCDALDAARGKLYGRQDA